MKLLILQTCRPEVFTQDQNVDPYKSSRNWQRSYMTFPQRKPPGKIVDELIQNPRRLGIAHFWLGMASAFVYWVRPGTFVAYIHLPRRGEILSLIFRTIVAWAPYVLSAIVSRSLLSMRAPQATFVFIACSACITAGAAGLYFNVFKMTEALSPLLISTGVAVALILVAALCALIWRSDVAV